MATVPFKTCRGSNPQAEPTGPPGEIVFLAARSANSRSAWVHICESGLKQMFSIIRPSWADGSPRTPTSRSAAVQRSD